MSFLFIWLLFLYLLQQMRLEKLRGFDTEVSASILPIMPTVCCIVLVFLPPLVVITVFRRQLWNSIIRVAIRYYPCLYNEMVDVLISYYLHSLGGVIQRARWLFLGE